MGNRAWDMITVRNEMQNAMEGKFGKYQKDVLDPLMKSYGEYGKEASSRASQALDQLTGSYDSLLGKAGGLASDISGDYTGVINRMRGLSSDVSSDYEKFQSGTIDPLKDTMYGMMTDESKRGYSEDTKNAMFGKQAEALTGAKASYQKNLGKTLASMGLGSAAGGSRMRLMNQYEAGYAKNLREASRDVRLADAEAKRSDLWNAVQGYGTAASLGEQALGKKTGALTDSTGMETSAIGSKAGAMTDLYGTEASLLGSKAGATSDLLKTAISAGFGGLEGQAGVAGMGQQNLRDELNYWAEKAGQSQAYSGVKNSESGFWKSFKNSLGSALGGSLGSFGMKSTPAGMTYGFGS